MTSQVIVAVFATEVPHYALAPPLLKKKMQYQNIALTQKIHNKNKKSILLARVYNICYWSGSVTMGVYRRCYDYIDPPVVLYE